MKNIVLSLVRLLTLALLAAPFSVFAAEPTVTDITAKQRYPWNGLVDISCKVSGIEADAGGYEFAAVAVDKDTGKEYAISSYSIEYGGRDATDLDVCENGDYKLLWNAREDLGQVVIERMAVRITLEGVALSVGKVQLWEGGPYWADRNIGAKKPEDSGLYFWWGDTVGYKRVNNAWVASDGSSSNFSFAPVNCPTDEDGQSVATFQSEGWITTDRILAPRHDAAHVHWGGRWRIPTYQELLDICFNKCDWTWTTINGIEGYIVRGRAEYASNSIFLPAAGYGGATHLTGSRGCYWSSYTEGTSRYLIFYSDFYGTFRFFSRSNCLGFSIRPVQ